MERRKIDLTTKITKDTKDTNNDQVALGNCSMSQAPPIGRAGAGYASPTESARSKFQRSGFLVCMVLLAVEAFFCFAFLFFDNILDAGCTA